MNVLLLSVYLFAASLYQQDASSNSSPTSARKPGSVERDQHPRRGVQTTPFSAKYEDTSDKKNVKKTDQNNGQTSTPSSTNAPAPKK